MVNVAEAVYTVNSRKQIFQNISSSRRITVRRVKELNDVLLTQLHATVRTSRWMTVLTQVTQLNY
jgi:hypothetical protein